MTPHASRAAWLFRIAASCVLLHPEPALAEKPQPEPSSGNQASSLELDALLGTSRAPYYTRAFREVSGYLALLTLQGDVALGRHFALGARLPLVLARVEQPGGSLLAEAAWANPELSAAYQCALVAPRRWTLSSKTQLALGLPLAQHADESSQLEGRALALADAIEGYSQPELYTPGVLPITATQRFVLRDRRWELTAALKLPLAVRIADADLPAETDTHQIALVPVLELGATLWITRRFGISVSPRLTVRAAPAVESEAGAVQLLLPAALQWRLGQHVGIAANFQAPVAGSLGGTTYAGGLGINAAF
jgi:hypothetical protein